MRNIILIDLVSTLDASKILTTPMKRRLMLADTKGYKTIFMFSKTVVDLHKRDELHYCTGFLTENFMPWEGIWIRDKMDDLRGISINELKAAWVNHVDRSTVARLYDFDPQCAAMWKREGFLEAEDHLYDLHGSEVDTVPVWVPEEVAEEAMEKQLIRQEQGVLPKTRH